MKLKKKMRDQRREEKQNNNHPYHQRKGWNHRVTSFEPQKRRGEK